MKKLKRIISVLLVFIFIFNTPASVFARIPENNFLNESSEQCITTESKHSHDGSEKGHIPDNAIVLTGQNAFDFIDNTNKLSINKINLRDVSEKIIINKHMEEYFSIIIFKTIEERDSFASKINLIKSDTIKQEYMNNLYITKSDLETYKTKNENTLYTQNNNDMEITNEDELIVYTIMTNMRHCPVCKVMEIIIFVGSFIASVREIWNFGVGIVVATVQVTTTLMCNHDITDSYESQTQCPHGQWCMGSPYLIYDYGGYASFACTCGAQWNFSYN